MVTSTRVQHLSNKSDEITTLMEFINNPNLVTELQEEIKKLNALTGDEEKQHHEAKILIQQRESLIKEIAQKKAEMAAELDEHKKGIALDKSELEKHVSETLAAIDAEHTKLDDRKAAIDDHELRNKQWENKLKETAAKMKGLIGE